MEDLHAIGGVPAVMKLLLEKGLIDGSRMTVTGKTIEDNLRGLPGLSRGQQIVHSFDKPIKRDGHIRVLRGNLAPDGAVVKLAGHEKPTHRGPARVFDSEQSCKEAVYDGVVLEDEPPLVSDWQKLTNTPNVVVVPFFISDGLHSYEDIPVLLGITNEGSTTNSRAARGEIFRRNPYETDGRLLFYAPSIGTDAGFADIIIEQAAKFDSDQSRDGGMN